MAFPTLTAQTYRSTLAGVIFAISGAAAISLYWSGSLLSHGFSSSAQSGHWLGELLFLIDWQLMCTAMMLPTAMPLLAAMQRTVSRKPNPATLVGICAIGFLGVWLLAGVVVRAAEHLLSYEEGLSGWLPGHPQELAGGLLALAGIYLLTPIAQKCVSACRSPIGFIARHWTGRPDVGKQVARIGASYGWSCFGCCWPLMVVMCFVGMSNPLWMLVLTLVMVLQKQSSYGQKLTTVLGVLLLIGAVGLTFGWFVLPAVGMPMCSG